MNDNATLADLAERVYAEEIALGLSPKQAALVARCVRCSDEYRDAWLAGRAERLRECEEQKEELDYCPCLTGCPECGGVPNHVAWLKGIQAKEEGK